MLSKFPGCYDVVSSSWYSLSRASRCLPAIRWHLGSVALPRVTPGRPRPVERVLQSMVTVGHVSRMRRRGHAVDTSVTDGPLACVPSADARGGLASPQPRRRAWDT